MTKVQLLKDTATLVATAATAIVLVAGTANATSNKNTNQNINTNKTTSTNINTNTTKNLNKNVLAQIQGQAQGQHQSQDQNQGQAQSQRNKNDNRDNFEFSQKYEAAASSGALSLGSGSYGAAATKCTLVGRGQSWGIGGSGGAIPGTGQGLFNRNTTEESVDVFCLVSAASAAFYANDLPLQAMVVECMDPIKRYAREFIDPGVCEDIQQIVKPVIRPETESLSSAFGN